jgi:hypothetical protein
VLLFLLHQLSCYYLNEKAKYVVEMPVATVERAIAVDLLTEDAAAFVVVKRIAYLYLAVVLAGIVVVAVAVALAAVLLRQ